MKKSISILIPNYNGRQLLEEYLPHTYKAVQNANVPFEIIVVDDASTDDSVAYLKKNYPEILVFPNKENKGFSHTCNVGIFKAKHELILLLNSDIKLSEDYFENQWQCFRDPTTFGVMGKIIDSSQRSTKDSASLPRRFGMRLKRNKFYYTSNPEIPGPTVFLSGANALVDAEKIRILGGFDEIFSPFYSEDTDLSIRAWRMGWKCFYAFQSECDHIGAATINCHNLKPDVKSIYYRNRFIMHGIHLKGYQSTLFRLQTLFLDVIPKVLIGRFWVLKSYRAFNQYADKIKSSQKKMNDLMVKQQSNIGLFDIGPIMENLLNEGENKRLD